MGRKKWKKIVLACSVLMLLVFTFWYGGGADSLHGFSVSGKESKEQVLSEEAVIEDEKSDEEVSKSESEDSGTQQAKIEEPEEKENLFSEIVMHIRKKKSNSHSASNLQNNKNAQKNANKAADKAEKSNKKQSAKEKKESKTKVSKKNKKSSDYDKIQGDQATDAKEGGDESAQADADTINCQVSISCATLLDHMDELKESKRKLVPADGILLKTTTVKVKAGSSAFDVLCNVTKANKVHLEYSFTPAYKSYYIEGIGNLYTFDGGELSGWMYSINGEFMGYSCSSYTVKDGDVIKWLYTCDHGKDVGDYFKE
ncbi:MAG: DUF4430 domain-containing protein [Lachnospiraceae bacterium]|nr:DUF4430 domain-containing protein [Lachnospiraceae bacterium]